MNRRPYNPRQDALLACCAQVTILMCNRFSAHIFECFKARPRVTSEYTSWWLSFTFESPYEDAIKSVFDNVRQRSSKPKTSIEKANLHSVLATLNPSIHL